MHCSNGYLKQGGFPQLLSQFLLSSCYFKNFSRGRGTCTGPQIHRIWPLIATIPKGYALTWKTNYLLPCDPVITCARVIMISDQSVRSKRGGACYKLHSLACRKRPFWSIPDLTSEFSLSGRNLISLPGRRNVR